MVRPFGIALTALGLIVVAVQAQIPPPPQPRAEFEVLARGPVHEAFAEPVDGAAGPTPAIRVAPPPPLDEQPPADRPIGDEYEWVGGYWYWSDDRSEYIWVSGCWRNSPPGRDWLPGQWVKVRDGYHWVSGCWVPEGQQTLHLLPQPPAAVEEDPGQPPDAQSSFVPGTWVWKDTRYVWQPGQWVRMPAEWVWQPAHHVWTPAGYLFVDGFWDHPLEQRGLLYAPVAPPRQLLLAQQTIVFEPTYVVRPAFLAGALFVRAAAKHYFFGDYFEPQYRTAGYQPWFDYRPSRYSFDPLYSHYRAHRPGADWDRQVRALYEARYAGTSPRPPRTWADQQKATAAPPSPNVTPAAVQQAAALATARQAEAVGVKMQAVAQAQRTQMRAAAQQRAEAARTYQETQIRKLVEAQQGAAAPKAPVQVQVPTLPKPAAAPPAPKPPAGQPPAPKQPPGQAKKQPPPVPVAPAGTPKKDEPKKGKGDGKKDGG